MGKYDKLSKLVQEEQQFREDQVRLHEKHKDVEDNKVIVEKSSAVRSTLSFFKFLIRIGGEILLIALATVGVITLIYPSTREAFTMIISEIFEQIFQMI